MTEGNSTTESSALTPFFQISFVCLGIIVALTRWFNPSASSQSMTNESYNPTQFKSFQNGFFLVYMVAYLSDWLQGPYVYKLYQSYGFDQSEIAHLFVAGFISSAVFGTFIGSLADKYGRKKLGILYGICYGLSCITKLYDNYSLLMVGRILSGISTSLLFSVFDSWMISEHISRSFPAGLMADTFAKATFGNGLIAIFSGVLSTWLAENWGPVSPFMAALVFLILNTVLVAMIWNENYGDASIDVSQTFARGIEAIKKPKIFLLGSIQSLFEASMYTFVFLWTPLLQDTSGDDLAGGVLGLIFACYMVCLMLGSNIFEIFMKRYNGDAEMVGRYLLLAAATSMIIPIFSSNWRIIFFACLLFEICCGCYFPCFGYLKGKHIPENCRSAVMNFFRVPLNILVVVILLNVHAWSQRGAFTVVSVALMLSALGQMYLQKIIVGESHVHN